MKHFIDINSFKKKEIDQIISLAKKIKKNPKTYSSSCKDKTLGLIFEKQSLRTRLSFNVGMQKLGGSVLELQSNDIRSSKSWEILSQQHLFLLRYGNIT